MEHLTKEIPIVDAPCGPVRGFRMGSVAFLGIPFAEAPIGERRFMAPVPRARWEDVRDATTYGPTAQRRPFGPVTDIPEPSIAGEDTLSVNVFTPAPNQPEAKLPVFVWIHGGGYIAGSPASPWYDGAAFNRDDIVTVTVSYRLGFDGFGYIEDSDAPLNRGLLDQIAALTWVQRNIAAFGGDPERVTVGGQSAGGGSVLSLIASPRARGLFSQAICQSGAVASQSFANARGIASALAAILRGYGAQESGGGSNPTVDGAEGSSPTVDGAESGDREDLALGLDFWRQYSELEILDASQELGAPMEYPKDPADFLSPLVASLRATPHPDTPRSSGETGSDGVVRREDGSADEGVRGPENGQDLTNAFTGLLHFMPTVDGDVLPLAIIDAVAAGSGCDIPILIGSTRNEMTPLAAAMSDSWRSFRPVATLKRAGIPGPAARAYLFARPEVKDDCALTIGQILSDSLFHLPLVELLAVRDNARPVEASDVDAGVTVSRHKAGSWVYQFEWPRPTHGLALHCVDVPFAFDCLDDPYVAQTFGTPEAPQSLADAFHGSWVRFIREGNPGWEEWEVNNSGRIFGCLTCKGAGQATVKDGKPFTLERALVKLVGRRGSTRKR